MLQGGVVVTDNASNMRKAFDLVDVFDFPIFGDDENIPLTDDEESDSEDAESECSSVELVSDDDAVDSESENADLSLENSEDLAASPPLHTLGRLGCLSHTLQLAINEAIKGDEESKTFIGNVNNLMTFFKKSTLWSDELKKLTKLDVLQPAKTRWNATVDMIERFKNVGLLS